MARGRGCLTGCLTQLVLVTVGLIVFAWVLIVALNPWALHIGGRATPLLYWHGAGTVRAKSGRTFPLYLWFSPARPQGFHGGGRRDGKIISAHLQGDGWLCLAPGTVERMELSGEMYGGYLNDTNSRLDFRLLEWKRTFLMGRPPRGFFDVAGNWRGPDLVMDRPNEQGVRFVSGLLIDNAVVTLRWASYDDFEAACNATKSTSPPALR